MVNDNKPANTGHVSPTSTLQAIDATYYHVTDANGQPIAALLVLQDRLNRPVRAEVHLFDDLEDYLAESAIRQAQRLLQERYYSTEPVALRILQTYQSRTAVDIPLDVHAPPPDRSGQRRWSPVGLAAAAVGMALLILLAGWGLAGLLRDDSPVTSMEPMPQAAPLSELSATVSDTLEPANQPSMTGAGTLPPSRNARPDLGIGQRVRIRPEYKLTLRSEAGASAGVEVGFMENGQEALIVAGPELTAGESDTIVWWYVRLDDGLEAWAAANTSRFTLLERVATE